MHFGSIHTPETVPKLPTEFTAYLFAMMVLSACLLMFWGCSSCWALASRLIFKFASFFVDKSLSTDETCILYAMAKNPTKPMDLDRINFSESSSTKLEMHELTKLLKRKGLVHINDWDENLITLTSLGRVKALEIQRDLKANEAKVHP
jgi:hypothetical protein